MTYQGWQRGECYIGDYKYQTLNPPRKERKEPKIIAPKLTQNYGPFVLVPVYRTRKENWRIYPKFIGYIVTLQGWQWLTPKTLDGARAFADCIANDLASSIIRACVTRVIDTQAAA